jgi:RNA polymerase sigma-70 factor (ECF subfamily)
VPDDSVRGRAARALRARADADDLRRAYEEHVDSVFAFFAYSTARDAAEDLTAATFERVIRAWSSYDPARAGLRTWILAIARNQLLDHLRRQKHRDHPSLDEHPLLAESVTQDDGLQRRLDRAEVVSWLANLSERERLVLALRYGADLDAREVGRLTELTEANVHQIISRALRKLRAIAQAERLPGLA